MPPMPPGCLPTLWNADDRFREGYLTDFPGYYRTGDAGYLDEDGYGYDLAYDGTGGMNCWNLNDFTGETGPPDIETLYVCDSRIMGTPYPPVQAHLLTSAGQAQTRPQEEPPDPKRPRCQKGAPGCNR